jgi:hypothetical protein
MSAGTLRTLCYASKVSHFSTLFGHSVMEHYTQTPPLENRQCQAYLHLSFPSLHEELLTSAWYMLLQLKLAHPQ